MHFVLQQVLDEKVVESATLAPTKETSKMKPVCAHGSNSVFGPYVEDDACEFCKHLQEAHPMEVDKIGWLDSSTSWLSLLLGVLFTIPNPLILNYQPRIVVFESHCILIQIQN